MIKIIDLLIQIFLKKKIQIEIFLIEKNSKKNNQKKRGVKKLI
jgi:hypothetical protein